MTADHLTDWILSLGTSIVTLYSAESYREYDFNNPASPCRIGNHQAHEEVYGAQLSSIMKSGGVVIIRNIIDSVQIPVVVSGEDITYIPAKDIYMFRADESGLFAIPVDQVRRAACTDMKTGRMTDPEPGVTFKQYSLASSIKSSLEPPPLSVTD